MYESHLYVHQQQQEADIFEDLSQLIKSFKKILNLSKEIMDNLDSPACLSLVGQLKELPKSHKQLADHYNQKTDVDSPNKNTINRFICRLYETISLFKSNCPHRDPANVLYRQFLEKAEQAITSYQVERNVGKMFKKILYFTERFCLSCEIILNDGFKEQILNYFSKEEHQGRQLPNSQHQQARKDHVPSRTESNFHKAMTVLNRRFNTLSCLDIDYNSYKGYYFQSRNQKQELYNDFIQRNTLIWRQINMYSKQFSVYLKRKERSSFIRKNKFNLNTESPLKNTSPVNKSKAEIAKNKERSFFQTERDNSKNKDNELPTITKNIRRPYFSQKKGDSTLNFNFKDGQSRKPQCHVKNIYLNLNKISNSKSSVSVEKQPKSFHKKSFKQKSQPVTNFKVAKVSLRTTKFIQMQKGRQKPLLDIKQIQSRNFGFTIDNNLTKQIGLNIFGIEQSRPMKSNTIKASKKSITDKKNLRIAQIMNKSNLVNKVEMSDAFNDEEMLYHIRVLNCEDEESHKQ